MNSEAGPPGLSVVSPYRPAVGSDDVAGYGQAEAVAVFSSAVKGVEHVLQGMLVQSAAVVNYVYFYLAQFSAVVGYVEAVVDGRLHGYVAGFGLTSRDRVGNQVEKQYL